LRMLGIELDDEMMALVTQRVIELGDKKEVVTIEELPFIVSDIVKNSTRDDSPVKVLDYSTAISKGLRPMAIVKMEINGEVYQQSAAGEGQYHAISKAMYKIYKKLNKPTPELVDYEVYIPPGGQTNAMVQTIITWKFNDKTFKTRGLSTDQTVSAIKATEKMLNIIEGE